MITTFKNYNPQIPSSLHEESKVEKFIFATFAKSLSILRLKTRTPKSTPSPVRLRRPFANVALLCLLLIMSGLSPSMANAQPLERMWINAFEHPPNAGAASNETFKDIAVGKDGYIYATGTGHRIVSENSADDYFTVKIDPSTGDTLWSRAYTRTVGGSNSSNAWSKKIAIDNDGNVYVSGGVYFSSSPDPVFDVVTIKYNPDGAVLWMSHSGAEFTIEYALLGNDYFDMKIANSGNIFIAGGHIILKYNSSGQLLWGINNINDVRIRALTIDSEENVIVTGSANPSPYSPGATKKYSSNGSLLWTIFNEDNGCGVFDARPFMNSIICDNNDDVYVGGFTCAGGSNHKTIRKYSKTGQVLWTRNVNTGGDIRDWVTNLGIDDVGNLYAGGQPPYLAPGDRLFGGDPVRKYNTNGDLLWIGEGHGNVLGFDNLGAVITYWKSLGNVTQLIAPYRHLAGYNTLTGALMDSASFLPPISSSAKNNPVNTAVLHNLTGDIKQIVTGGTLDDTYTNVGNRRILIGYRRQEVPMTPDSLVPGFVFPDTIRFTFTDNSIIETGFKIQRSPNNITWYDAIIFPAANPFYPFRVTYSADTASYSGVGFNFRIAAFNENGQSDWVAVNGTKYPTAPAQLKANYGPGNVVTLKWKDHSRIETGYKIERKTNNDTSFNQIGTTEANATSFVDDQLPSPSSGNIYEYRARAFKDNINSEYSNISIVVFEAPLAPDSLKVSPPEVGTAVLSWIPGSGNEEGYILERSTGSAANFIFRDSIPSDDTTYTDSGLTPGTTYWYRMYAYNPIGNSPYSDTVFILITGDITGSSEIPQSFTLYQNYPNPFNPVTNIKFDLPKLSHVKLMIYDMLGREVATLVNETRQAGRYELNWNASAFASGVYFYKIQADDFRDMKRLVLLK